MKYLLFSFLFLFLLASVSALGSDIHASYSPKETLIIKISGEIVEPIESDQVIFKRNNIFVPVEYDVQRLGETWYVWAIAPEITGNYTFILDNIVSASGNGVKQEDYQKGFQVTGNLSDYNIDPGFILSDEDFSIDVNVLAAEAQTISISFSSSEEKILQPGTTSLDFFISDASYTGLHTISIGKYQVPSYLIVAGMDQINQTVNTTNSSNTNATNSTSQNTTLSTNMTGNTTNISTTVDSDILSVEPSYIQRLLHKEAKSSTYSFIVRNPTLTNYKDIEIIYNGSLFDIEEDEFNLKAGENYTFTLILGKYPGYDLRERVYINTTNVTLEIPFFVRYTENVSDVAIFYGELDQNASNGIKRKTTYFCSELGGVVCSTSSSCSGEALNSKEGSCCLGICQQPESGGYGWVGWIIGAIAVLAVIYLYMRYKKAGSGPAPSLGKGP